VVNRSRLLAFALFVLGTDAFGQIAINPLTDSAPGLSQDLIQAGATSVTLTVRGSGFGPTSVVKFGNDNLQTVFIDGSTLMAIIPQTLLKSVGTVPVKVTNGSQSSNALNLTVVARGDANASNTLNIGDALVIARSVGGLVQSPVPSGVADVNLTDSLNIGDALVVALFAGGLNLNLATPAISSTNVTSTANPGTAITLTGTGFSATAEHNVVFFSRSDGNFIPVAAESVSSSGNQRTLTVTVPANAVSGPVFVKRKDLGLPGQPFGLSVANGAPPLYISRVSPVTSLTANDVLAITGTGFDSIPANNIVSFSGPNNTIVTAVPASATSISLTVAVPIGAVSGYVHVASGNRISNRKSILISGTPTPLLINHIYYPDFSGEPILIEGTGFNPSQPANNQVLFTGPGNTEILATVVAAGRTELIVLVPDGAVTGPLKIKTNNGQNVSNGFTYNAASLGPLGPFNGRIEYDYDVLNRLTEVRYPSTLIRYTYDPAGNRTSMTISAR